MTVKKTKFGFCDNPMCKKKLIVPSWKFCEDCDFIRYKKVYLKKEIASIKQKIFRETRKPKEEKYKDASVLVVDEFGKVIGYKL